MHPMLFVVRMLERVSGGVGVLAAWVVVPLIGATCFEVFSRYVLNAPTIWAFELGYMAMGTQFLLGAAFTLRERGHIRIDILYAHFRPKVQALIDVCGYLFLMLPACFWLMLSLWNYAADAYLSGELSGQSAWNPPIWPFRMVFFSAFAVLTLQGTLELIKAASVLFGWKISEHWKER
jgi:TRAP-type mannitol/chloroaromatic compound transport system permease small subunit